MTSCVTKLMAAQNLRLKEKFCALGFVVPTIASEAQEYYPGVYQAGFEWLGPFNPFKHRLPDPPVRSSDARDVGSVRSPRSPARRRLKLPLRRRDARTQTSL